MGENLNDRCRRLLPRFNVIWKEESEDGHWNAIDGVEYRRVAASWVLAGCPDAIREYIRKEANRGADECT